MGDDYWVPGMPMADLFYPHLSPTIRSSPHAIGVLDYCVTGKALPTKKETCVVTNNHSTEYSSGLLLLCSGVSFLAAYAARKYF